MSAALTARTVDRAQTDGRTRANTLILFGASADSSVKGSKSSSPSSSILWCVGSKFFEKPNSLPDFFKKPRFEVLSTELSNYACSLQMVRRSSFLGALEALLVMHMLVSAGSDIQGGDIDRRTYANRSAFGPAVTV